jgi:hypothetical protein
MPDEVQFWMVGEIVREELPDTPIDDTTGIAVFTGLEDGPGEIVCYLHRDNGSHFENLPDAEHNAQMIAAMPSFNRALVRMANIFRPVAHHLGGEYSEALATAEAVIRSVLSEEEQMADIERVLAEFTGEIQ